jgi:hypothetical protein
MASALRDSEQCSRPRGVTDDLSTPGQNHDRARRSWNDFLMGEQSRRGHGRRKSLMLPVAVGLLVATVAAALAVLALQAGDNLSPNATSPDPASTGPQADAEVIPVGANRRDRLARGPGRTRSRPVLHQPLPPAMPSGTAVACSSQQPSPTGHARRTPRSPGTRSPSATGVPC